MRFGKGNETRGNPYRNQCGYESVLSEDQLPGEILYEYPGDVSIGEDQRLVRVLEVVLPDGEFGFLAVPGEWGGSFSEDAFNQWEASLLDEAARAWGDEDGPKTLAVMGRSYRIEERS